VPRTVKSAHEDEDAPPKPRLGKRTLSSIGLGSSTSGRRARDADELLADAFARD